MKVMVIKQKLSPDECLKKIEPYLRDITTDLQKSDTYKIQLDWALKIVHLLIPDPGFANRVSWSDVFLF